MIFWYVNFFIFNVMGVIGCVCDFFLFVEVKKKINKKYCRLKYGVVMCVFDCLSDFL